MGCGASKIQSEPELVTKLIPALGDPLNSVWKNSELFKELVKAAQDHGHPITDFSDFIFKKDEFKKCLINFFYAQNRSLGYLNKTQLEFYSCYLTCHDFACTSDDLSNLQDAIDEIIGESYELSLSAIFAKTLVNSNPFIRGYESAFQANEITELFFIDPVTNNRISFRAASLVKWDGRQVIPYIQLAHLTEQKLYLVKRDSYQIIAGHLTEMYKLLKLPEIKRMMLLLAVKLKKLKSGSAIDTTIDTEKELSEISNLVSVKFAQWLQIMKKPLHEDLASKQTESTVYQTASLLRDFLNSLHVLKQASAVFNLSNDITPDQRLYTTFNDTRLLHKSSTKAAGQLLKLLFDEFPELHGHRELLKDSDFEACHHVICGMFKSAVRRISQQPAYQTLADTAHQPVYSGAGAPASYEETREASRAGGAAAGYVLPLLLDDTTTSAEPVASTISGSGVIPGGMVSAQPSVSISESEEEFNRSLELLIRLISNTHDNVRRQKAITLLIDSMENPVILKHCFTQDENGLINPKLANLLKALFREAPKRVSLVFAFLEDGATSVNFRKLEAQLGIFETRQDTSDFVFFINEHLNEYYYTYRNQKREEYKEKIRKEIINDLNGRIYRGMLEHLRKEHPVEITLSVQCKLEAQAKENKRKYWEEKGGELVNKGMAEIWPERWKQYEPTILPDLLEELLSAPINKLFSVRQKEPLRFGGSTPVSKALFKESFLYKLSWLSVEVKQAIMTKTPATFDPVLIIDAALESPQFATVLRAYEVLKLKAQYYSTDEQAILAGSWYQWNSRQLKIAAMGELAEKWHEKKQSAAPTDAIYKQFEGTEIDQILTRIYAGESVDVTLQASLMPSLQERRRPPVLPSLDPFVICATRLTVQMPPLKAATADSTDLDELSSAGGELAFRSWSESGLIIQRSRGVAIAEGGSAEDLPAEGAAAAAESMQYGGAAAGVAAAAEPLGSHPVRIIRLKK